MMGEITKIWPETEERIIGFSMIGIQAPGAIGSRLPDLAELIHCGTLALPVEDARRFRDGLARVLIEFDMISDEVVTP